MDWERKAELRDLLVAAYTDCDRCTLCQPVGRKRHNVVFGEGNLDADVVIVGEAPGSNEDLTGRPFAGRSGDLLNQFFSAINVNREEAYVINVVGCWPTEEKVPKKSRAPTRKEINSCLPLIHRTIEIVDPYVLLLLGSTALKAMTQDKRSITKIARDDRIPALTSYTRGLQVDVPRTAFATFHPAALLRNRDKGTEDIESALRTWRQAFLVADKHSQVYRGTTPRFGA